MDSDLWYVGKEFVENFKKSSRINCRHRIVSAFTRRRLFCKRPALSLTMVNDALVRLVKASSQEEVIGNPVLIIIPKRADEFHADDQIVYDTGEALINRLEMIIDETGVMPWFSTNNCLFLGRTEK